MAVTAACHHLLLLLFLLLDFVFSFRFVSLFFFFQIWIYFSFAAFDYNEYTHHSVYTLDTMGMLLYLRLARIFIVYPYSNVKTCLLKFPVFKSTCLPFDWIVKQISTKCSRRFRRRHRYRYPIFIYIHLVCLLHWGHRIGF